MYGFDRLQSRITSFFHRFWWLVGDAVFTYAGPLKSQRGIHQFRFFLSPMRIPHYFLNHNKNNLYCPESCKFAHTFRGQFTDILLKLLIGVRIGDRKNLNWCKPFSGVRQRLWSSYYNLSSVCGRVCPETTLPFMGRRAPNCGRVCPETHDDHHNIRWQSVCTHGSQGGNPSGKAIVVIKSVLSVCVSYCLSVSERSDSWTVWLTVEMETLCTKFRADISDVGKKTCAQSFHLHCRISRQMNLRSFWQEYWQGAHNAKGCINTKAF